MENRNRLPKGRKKWDLKSRCDELQKRVAFFLWNIISIGWDPTHDNIPSNVMQPDDSLFLIKTKEILFVVSWTLNYVYVVCFGMV